MDCLHVKVYFSRFFFFIVQISFRGETLENYAENFSRPADSLPLLCTCPKSLEFGSGLNVRLAVQIASNEEVSIELDRS